MTTSRYTKTHIKPSRWQRLLHGIYSRWAVLPQTRWQRVRQRFYNRIATTIFRLGDPLLEQTVAGTRLLMPFSHRLPMYLQRHPRYSSNLGRLARYVQLKYPDMTMIDVGANIGDTIAIVRSQVDCPILCIEGDPAFLPLLETNASRFPNVRILETYLGEADERAFSRSIQHHGTAHLSAASSGEPLNIQRLDTLLREHAAFWNAKLLKTDTDGYDGKVLRGAAKQLEAVKPVLFFEYDPHFLAEQKDDPLNLLGWLQSLGYHRLIFYDNFGELLLDTDTSNLRQLQEVTSYFTGHKAQRYCDVCAFHRIDEDVFDAMIFAELEITKSEPIRR